MDTPITVFTPPRVSKTMQNIKKQKKNVARNQELLNQSFYIVVNAGRSIHKGRGDRRQLTCCSKEG